VVRSDDSLAATLDCFDEAVVVDAAVEDEDSDDDTDEVRMLNWKKRSRH